MVVLGLMVASLVILNRQGAGQVVTIENINNIAMVNRDIKLNNAELPLADDADIKKCGGIGLYPEESPDNDRVVEQLSYTPCKNTSRPKKIMIWNGVENWGGIRPKNGDEVFKRESCLVNNCVLTSDKSDLAVDLIIFKDGGSRPRFQKPLGQLWMIYLLESPFHVASRLTGFDWTATYRRDSTIVAPYAKWAYFDRGVTRLPQTINYARNKTKQVAWFVSNCNAKNNRLEYAKELANYIQVDIYGGCGNKKCPKKSEDCKSMLSRDYKFYLSFENSNCQDYITEKLFSNALQDNIIPVVMGASLEEYNRVAPHGSFIHVDQFDGPKELATYLHTLDDNQELYNKYFEWKGTGEFIATKFFCRVCAMLHYHHEKTEQPAIKDWETWWKGPGVCQERREDDEDTLED